MELFANFRRSPFARLLFFFILGIFMSSWWHGHVYPDFLLFPLSLLLILMVLMLITSGSPGYNTNFLKGIMAVFSLFILGFISMSIHYRAGAKAETLNGKAGMACFRICEQPVITEKSVKVITEIITWDSAKLDKTLRKQKLLVFFQKDTLSGQLEAGDRVIAQVELNSMQPPGNPGEFDYGSYMAARGIYHNTYIPSGKWKFSELNDGFSLRAEACKIQKYLLNQYQKIGLNKTHYSILSALTLGYKNDLEAFTKQVFSKAGVMHVMALSGFNVAVIAFMLGYVLFFSEWFPRGRIVKTILIIIVIWLFAFITGLSASVTRAALMISLVMSGKLIQHRIITTNILYASAFILLAVSPALLGDISFQLSFAAVLGIVVFQPALFRLVTFRYFIPRKIWQLFTVSFAAQLSTLSLTLFYFHQFPVYFWLTNLYVVPLVSVIICVAGVYLMVSFFEPLMLVTGKVLSFLLHLLFQGVSFTEMLPLAMIENISINVFQVMLLSGIIFVTGLFTVERKKYLILAALCLLLIFQLVSIFRLSSQQHQSLIMVTNCGKGPVLNVIYGRKGMLISEEVLSAGDQQLKYGLENFWIGHGVSTHIEYATFSSTDALVATLPGNNKLFDFYGQRIMVLKDVNNSGWHASKPLKIDLLIVAGKIPEVMMNLPEILDPGCIIIDPSMGYYLTEKWVQICQKWNRNYWVVARQGAYLTEI